MMKNLKIQTVGFDGDKVGDFKLEKIKALIQKTFDTLEKVTKIEMLKIHLKMHNVNADSHKYSTHIHLTAKDGAFDCEDFEWDALTSTSKTLNTLESLVKKHITKKADITKHKGRNSKETE